ncbi:histidine phosphatase superfamily [Usnea florida]
MLSHTLLLFTLLHLPLTQAAETVLGLYIFSRHGDRTTKAYPPTKLTDLGYSEVFSSGTWFRENYINGSSPINGIEPNVVKLSQISASAPMDTVLMPSTQGFLQGLYPPVGATLGSQTLGNGTVVTAPLDGFQLIPVQTVTSGTGSEDSAWLQGASNCAKAEVSSNNYFSSPEYMALLNSTQAFYSSILPTVNTTFNGSQTSFSNAYTIFDYLNVAEIHNATIPSSDLLTPETLLQIRTLADVHEFNLAYNASDPIRAVAGATLAAQIVSALNTTITSNGTATPLNIQFGAYGQFQSFFGLANLTSLGADWIGIPDYASTMTFELFTDVAPTPFPAVDDLQVRFYWHNGTTGNTSTPTAYPLFGQQSLTLGWNDFVTGMNKFAIGSQSAWCNACGNTTGVCASSSLTSPSSGGKGGSSATGSGGGSGSGGVSRPVAGVIGAIVTLAVVLGVEGLIMLVAGLRLVSKKRLGAGAREGAVRPKA